MGWEMRVAAHLASASTGVLEARLQAEGQRRGREAERRVIVRVVVITKLVALRQALRGGGLAHLVEEELARGVGVALCRL